MDFTQAVHDYSVWHRTSGHTQRTIGFYQQKLGAFHRWLQATGRSTDIESISLADAREFVLAEQQRTVKYSGHPYHNEESGTLSDRTIDSVVRAIKAFWSWLHTEEYISRDPMTRLRRPKLEQRFKEIVGDEDVAHLLRLCNQRSFSGARLYALIAVLYDTGVRAGEVASLNVQDIDLRQYQVRVTRGKARKERLVPFSQATYKAIRRYLVLRDQYVDDPTCDALFITRNRQRMRQNTITQLVKKLGKRAGIPRLHPHLLRHSAAVAYLLNGGDPHSLRRILGHSELSTTDVYTSFAQQHLAQQHAKFSPMSRVDMKASVRPKKRRT